MANLQMQMSHCPSNHETRNDDDDDDVLGIGTGELGGQVKVVQSTCLFQIEWME